MSAWTKREDQLLKKLYPQGVKVAAGRLPLRTKRSIICRAARLKIQVTEQALDKHRWTDAEDEILNRFYRQFGSRFCQGGMQHRSREAICARAALLGVRRDQSVPACNIAYDDWIEVERLALYVKWT
ncbi:MAG: hypothetical protein GY753_09725 [Gammaproteobacteria bacterium]|nr:hypothetical protein [Gammaproteobacteria bacterium]